ncbi:MAG: hypothetical protein HY810_07970 [Candidatus Omnitrophica bacterium]|nr:hypothetical protein [Candidatus Omnitrophota bacterium]
MVWSKKLSVIVILVLTFLFAAVNAHATFTTGETYTISIYKISSSGSLNATASTTTLATADSNGKLSFSLSNVPTSSECNFLLVTITSSNNVAVRRSIVPAPTSGSTMDFGVSPLTDAQTTAFLNAFSTAQTDDPLLAFFGFVMVRTSNTTAAELAAMATICQKGIKGTDGTGITDGFEAKLVSEGVTASQMANFRRNIVSNLSVYTSLYKDAVDQYFSSGANAELEKRGEAASKIFEIIVDAAADTGIETEKLLYAFNAMGAIVLPLMDQGIINGSLSENLERGLESTIGRGLDKLRADNFLRKYNDALTALGATTEEITAYNNAVNTLTAAMRAQFEDFEKNCMKDDTDVDKNAMAAKDTEMQAGMQNAFNQFMTDCQSTNAQILDLRNRLASAFGYNAAQRDQFLPTRRFQFLKQNASSEADAVNWPIMMVVATRYMADIVIAGGSVTYTRDTTTAPAAMWWLGYCQTNAHWDQGTCAANHSGQWVVGRRNYTNMYPAECVSWAALEGLREDIQILQFKRWGAFSNEVAGASDDSTRMNAMETAEKDFYSKLFNSDSSTALINLLGGTTNGTTAIPLATRKALITVFLDPDF